MVRLLLPQSKAILPILRSCGKNTWFKILRNVAQARGSNEGTLKYQDTLPKFPVPPLQQTCENYLKQYQPHVTDHEFERTKKMVENFCKPGGTGELLQGALLRRSDLKENWLSDWWREYYLQVRDPNVLTSSPALLMHRQGFSDLNGQIEYAAKLVYGISRFASSLARHEFPPIKVRGQPICMDPFFLGFSSCRIPGGLVDTFYSQRLDLPDAPRHVVVIRNNHMFKFNILDPDMNPLDAASILKQLERIVHQTQDLGPPIGLVTAQPRTRWAKIYSKMKEDETNAKSLHDIASSLFVLSLDQTEFVEDTEERKFHEARLALCGGGSKRNSGNRWHDKTAQFFIGSNGESGMAGDHSLGDGIFAQTLAEMASQSKNKNDRLTSNSARSGLPCPQKLEFVLSDDLICAMSEAGKQIDHILGYFSTQEKTFSSFGKTFLKSHNVAHDGFVQIAIQMTYWRLLGRLPCVFEAVSIQRFKLGRVENVRTVTDESSAFIKMFHDENVQSLDKSLMLHKALEVHVRKIRDAKMGQGMERHLFGLQRIATEENVDASDFFDDPSWKNSCLIDIRSTGLPGDASRALYAPLIQTSSAFIWYCFNPDFMRFTITVRQDKNEIDAKKFLEELFACMLDLKILLESVSHTED